MLESRFDGRPSELLIISGFCLGRGNVADGAEKPAIVKPVYPVERRHFNALQAAPRSEAMDHLCLVQAVDRFSKCVIVGVATLRTDGSMLASSR